MRISVSVLTNIVLATVLVTSLFFVAGRGERQYNAWVDINEDGQVDILDLANVAKAFGMQGDPTRNVNVMNLPSWKATRFDLNFAYSSMPWTFVNDTLPYYVTRYPVSFAGGSELCLGYSRLFLHLDFYSWNFAETNTTFYISDIVWNSTVVVVSSEQFDSNVCNVTIGLGMEKPSDHPWGKSNILEVEVKAEAIEYVFVTLKTDLWAPGIVSGSLAAYWRNE